MSETRSTVMDVDHEGLARICERVDGAKAEFHKLSAELQSQLAGMCRDWQGQGGSAFGSLLTEWLRRHSEITQVLETFEASLTQTRRTTTAQDAAQASGISALAGLINH